MKRNKIQPSDKSMMKLKMPYSIKKDLSNSPMNGVPIINLEMGENRPQLHSDLENLQETIN